MYHLEFQIVEESGCVVRAGSIPYDLFEDVLKLYNKIGEQ